jgi:antitoxin CcdA
MRTTQGKKAVNLTVAATLLEEARAQGINLSALLEDALAEALRRSRRERWLRENAAGMAAYNAQVDEHGAFADTLRSF